MQKSGELRQLVDWSAAIWAGVIGGVIFLILNFFINPFLFGSDPFFVFRLFASVIMGQATLSLAGFDLTSLVLAVVLHFALSISFALIVAFITHRGGLVQGIIVGGLIGLALYAITYFLAWSLFPWFLIQNTWLFFVAHIVFGMIVGGLYEGFEVEEFVPHS